MDTPTKTLATSRSIAPAHREPPLACRRMLKGHFGKVYAAQWAPDSQHLASVSQDSSLILWDTYTAAKKITVKLSSAWIMSCAVAPSMRMLATSGMDNACTLLQVDAALTNATVVKELAQHEGYVACCRFVDDTHVLTASGDATCILWDTTTGTPVTTFTGHAGDVMSVSLLPQGHSVFVSGACDHKAKLWDLRTPACIATYDGHTADVNSVDFLSSGRGFGTGSDDATCKVFDLRADGPLCTLTNDRITSSVKSIGLSKSGRLLFAGYPGREGHDQQFLVWDTVTCTIVGAPTGHDNDVSAVAVAPDGMSVCTASWDTVIRVRVAE